MADYALYQQMLQSELVRRGKLSSPAPFVSYVSKVDKHFSEEEREAFEERAAIMEYDGGLTRTEAEKTASILVLDEFRNRRNKRS